LPKAEIERGAGGRILGLTDLLQRAGELSAASASAPPWAA
jgi:hypothetical protein